MTLRFEASFATYLAPPAKCPACRPDVPTWASPCPLPGAQLSETRLSEAQPLEAWPFSEMPFLETCPADY